MFQVLTRSGGSVGTNNVMSYWYADNIERGKISRKTGCLSHDPKGRANTLTGVLNG